MWLQATGMAQQSFLQISFEKETFSNYQYRFLHWDQV